MSFTPDRLRGTLEHCLAGAADPAPTGLCVALSGGLDSTVLLCALTELRGHGCLPLPVRAVHVDHGLQPDSAAWSDACVRLAAAQAVDCRVFRVNAAPVPGASPEAAARDARYRALRAALAPGEVLVTAHHADDQLETILLQWLRGGGLQAVAGMAGRARFGAGWHARPLLDFTRDALHEWAMARHVSWLEDPSNLDPRFDRNYLRLQVLPVLRRRWPSAARTVARVAEFAADALALERETAASDLGGVGHGCTLSMSRLQILPAARQRAVLRAWLGERGLPVPPSRTLEALRHDMRVAAPDRTPMVRWPGVAVRRYRDRLYADATAPGDAAAGEWCAEGEQCWSLGDGSRIELVAAVGDGLSRSRLPRPLRVARRVAGATFRPAGTAHRRPLRKWFQDRGVLPWRRDSIPLLCHGDRIVAVADISCAAEYAAQPDEPSWHVAWRGRPMLTESEALAANWRCTPPFD